MKKTGMILLIILRQPTPEYIAYYNELNAEFADLFFITELFILIQDKQLIASCKKVIEAYSAIMLERGLVEKEHNNDQKFIEKLFYLKLFQLIFNDSTITNFYTMVLIVFHKT
jgi:hypothetical protein